MSEHDTNETTPGSENIFEELGLPDAGALRMKVDLAATIHEAMREEDSPRPQRGGPGNRPGCLADLLEERLSRVGFETLFRCLTVPGFEVEVVVRKNGGGTLGTTKVRTAI